MHFKRWAGLAWLFVLFVHGPTQGQTGSYEILWNAKRAASPALSSAGLAPLGPASAATGFDVQHYVIDIEVDPVAKTVAGHVDVTFGRRRGVPRHDQSLSEIQTCRCPRSPWSGSLAFTRPADRIHILLGAVHTVGDTLTVRVDYSGAPVDQGLRFRSKVVFNISEPDMARNWFPCYDEPWDKATSEMICTVPGTLYCVSNGSFSP